MFNPTLYRQGMRSSRTMLAIFISVLAVYFGMIIFMFDPEIGKILTEFSLAMPELMSMAGMIPASGTLTSFLSAYLYGFLMLVFPMIYSIILANRLMARHVERGSMAYLLAAPVRRTAVAFTQLCVLITGIASFTVFVSAFGIICSELWFPGELDIPEFILLNAGNLCLQLFIAGICLLCSCAFGDSKYTTAFSAGIPSLAYIIEMLANIGGDLEGAKHFTFFTLFDPDGLIAREPSALIGSAILLAVALVLFAVSIRIFDRKDLAI